MKSQELEQKPEMKIKIQEKRQELEFCTKMTWIDTQFLSSALKTLSECRQTLQNTYIFAYYQEASTSKEIFENNQTDLELSTEKLSEYLERDLDTASENLSDLKQNVQNLCNYVESRRKVLLKHVREGCESGAFMEH